MPALSKANLHCFPKVQLPDAIRQEGIVAAVDTILGLKKKARALDEVRVHSGASEGGGALPGGGSCCCLGEREKWSRGLPAQRARLKPGRLPDACLRP